MDTRKRLQYLRAFIVLLAGLIVFVFDMKNHVDLTPMLIRLLLVMLGFYVIGSIVIWAIKKALDMPTKEDQEAERLALEQAEAEQDGNSETTEGDEVTE